MSSLKGFLLEGQAVEGCGFSLSKWNSSLIRTVLQGVGEGGCWTKGKVIVFVIIKATYAYCFWRFGHVLSLTEALDTPSSPQVLTMSQSDVHLHSRLIPPPWPTDAAAAAAQLTSQLEDVLATWNFSLLFISPTCIPAATAAYMILLEHPSIYAIPCFTRILILPDHRSLPGTASPKFWDQSSHGNPMMVTCLTFSYMNSLIHSHTHTLTQQQVFLSAHGDME